MFRRTSITAFAFIALPVAVSAFGGWAVITVDSLPEYAVAGTPTTLTFTVRQHGMTPLFDLRPSVVARNGSTVVEAKTGTTPNGHYSATMTLPRDGAWTVDIRSGFMNSTRATPLMPMRVIAAGATAPPSLPDALRGKHLFVAKGCVTCHVHPETPEWESISAGPNLTGRRYVPEILATFLDDPDKSPLSQNPKSGIGGTTYVRMPKLGLDAREIAALVAFVNGGSSVASRAGSDR
ncbi:MAG TPA: cytochrome c [Gemmatimonadaceae bacterium]